MHQQRGFRLPGVELHSRPPRPFRYPLPRTTGLEQIGASARPETPADIPFIRSLYARSRSAEMAMLGWDAPAQQDFVEKQFAYQYVHHTNHYDGADFAIVDCGGRASGRLYLHWGFDGNGECRIFEFQLLPEFRNRGLGSALLAAVLRQAKALHRPVSLHVDPISPARRLYTRFGFVTEGAEIGTGSLLMRWRDGPVEPQPALVT